MSKMEKYRTQEEMENEVDMNIVHYHKFVHINEAEEDFLRKEFDATREELIQVIGSNNFSLVIYEETLNSEKYKSHFEIPALDIPKINIADFILYKNAIEFFKDTKYDDVNIFSNEDVIDAKRQIAELK